VFAARGLDRYFASILGSPQTKAELIDSLRSELAEPGASVFLGDSRADYEAAVYARADFVFVSKYTEFSDWRCFTASQPETRVVETLSELLA
jgi:phosphoglycolate phosphatase-like HAD superfamily hydrolase